MVHFPSKLQVFPSKSENFPGMRLPNSTFFPCMHLTFLTLTFQPENVMLKTRTGNDVKIIDFGLARELAPNEQVRIMFGTPEFVAPEVVNFEPIGQPTDMWSLGILAFVM